MISGVLLLGLYVLLTRDNTADSIAAPSTNYVATEASFNTTNTTTATNSGNSSTTNYQDGTYTANVSYNVPHGSNDIAVTVTVKNGSVESVKTSHDYTDRESGEYISNFETQIAQAVVGQPISSATVNRLGGASLTSQAFNQAVKQIEQQATA